MSGSAQTGTITTHVPARLDRLPWSRFHWRVVVGLGGVWILDGLEVTMVGNVSSRLTEHGSGIALTPADIGMAAAIYIAGACLGALFFGHLTDRFGRRNLFILTLAVYLAATVATAFAFAPWFFFLARFFTGSGIGGEYAAINSAIDELIPARVRGRVDLVINGTYWLGSAAGAGGALVLLDTSNFPANIGWRLAFGVGAIFGIFVLLVRRNVPESPRWLFIHGHNQEAERIVGEIEADVRAGNRPAAAGAAGQAAENPSARDDFVCRNRPGRFHALSAARDPRAGAVHRTGVSLQRRDVQSGHLAERLLRNRRRQGAAVLHSVGAEQLFRAAGARAALRHRRPQTDDRLVVYRLGGRGRRSRGPVRRTRPAACGHSSACSPRRSFWLRRAPALPT